MKTSQSPSGRDPARLTSDPETKLRLETEILYDLFPSMQWVHLAAVLVVFGLLLKYVEFGALLDWLGLMLLIMCLRVLISQRYERAPKPVARPQFWFNWVLIGVLLYGVGWSGTAILFVPVENVEIAAFTALLLCGLGAGAVAFSSVNLQVFLVYAASTMWPYAALLIATQHHTQALIGWLILLFFFAIGITAMRVHTFFARLVDLQGQTRFLESEVRHESRKREFAERALLENTLEEELAEMIRKQTALLHDAAPAARDGRPATVDEINAVRAYLRRLNDLLASQVQSAEKFVHLVLDSNLSRDQRQYMSVVEKILHNAGLVLKRIDPATTVADLDAGIERRRFNLWRALTYLTHEMPLAQKAKFVTLRRRVEKNVPQFVIGDDAKLGEILQHLIRNAMENSDGGTITIAVEKTDEDETSVGIDFKVIDTGVGMRRDILDALQQPEPGATLDPRGGLATARAWVQALGGSLYASSLTGAGTTVGFRLRFGKDQATLAI
jgi:signal transduction histidine kinase